MKKDKAKEFEAIGDKNVEAGNSEKAIENYKSALSIVRQNDDKNTLGTFINFAHASSVNFTSGSILDAAYFTVSKLIPLLAGIGSEIGLLNLVTESKVFKGW